MNNGLKVNTVPVANWISIMSVKSCIGSGLNLTLSHHFHCPQVKFADISLTFHCKPNFADFSLPALLSLTFHCLDDDDDDDDDDDNDNGWMDGWMDGF